MKKTYSFIMKLLAKISICLMLIFSFQACDKSIEESALPTLVPSGVDETGGNWKTIVVPTASSIAVPQPAETSSAEYTAELNELKTITANLTSAQKDAI